MDYKLVFVALIIATFGVILGCVAQAQSVQVTANVLPADNNTVLIEPDAYYDRLANQIIINPKNYYAESIRHSALHEIGHYYFIHKLSTEEKIQMVNDLNMDFDATSEYFAEAYANAFDYTFNAEKVPGNLKEYFKGEYK